MTTAACRGFVYATAVMGVTGARTTTSDLAGPLVARTRAVTDLPVGVGLGVSNGDQAAEVAAYADGVIVGSAFVRALLDTPTTGPPGSRRCATLTEDLADGVRRGVGRGPSPRPCSSCGCSLRAAARRVTAATASSDGSDDDGYTAPLLDDAVRRARRAADRHRRASRSR